MKWKTLGGNNIFGLFDRVELRWVKKSWKNLVSENNLSAGLTFYMVMLKTQ
jgi:hypothetical protein